MPAVHQVSSAPDNILFYDCPWAVYPASSTAADRTYKVLTTVQSYKVDWTRVNRLVFDGIRIIVRVSLPLPDEVAQTFPSPHTSLHCWTTSPSSMPLRTR